MDYSEITSQALTELGEIETAGIAAFKAVNTGAELDAVRIEFVGQKNGKLKQVQEKLKSIEPHSKQLFGAHFNLVKQTLEIAQNDATTRVLAAFTQNPDQTEVANSLDKDIELIVNTRRAVLDGEAESIDQAIKSLLSHDSQKTVDRLQKLHGIEKVAEPNFELLLLKFPASDVFKEVLQKLNNLLSGPSSPIEAMKSLQIPVHYFRSISDIAKQVSLQAPEIPPLANSIKSGKAILKPSRPIFSAQGQFKPGPADSAGTNPGLYSDDNFGDLTVEAKLAPPDILRKYRPKLGHRHPLTQTADELIDLFGRFGFAVARGPEVEDVRHNFDALNIPPVHPARDPLDNFYLSEGTMLRSQTSTVQIRVMEGQPPPVRVIAIGRVYRPDTVDATHSFMFHQIEGLMVDKGVTMADLKTVLRLFARSYLGEDVKIRFRPSFFPFTEPSVEVDMLWHGGDRWVEMGGAGMVDPNVFREVGYDPDEVTGFAFGLGIERLCMRRHGIDDIRLLYQNEGRFLSQF